MADLGQAPSPGTLPHLFLLLTAISGEFPAQLICRLPGGAAYKENVIKQLKRKRLLKTFYRDGLRGFRVTSAAKVLLLAQYPEHLRPYLTGSAETNALKSEVPRRMRLHRMAEILTIMFNADVRVFGWEKAPIFKPAPFFAVSSFPLPAYYSSRELKELGALAIKVRGSRSTGVLLVDGGIFVVYNTGSSLMKWEYKSEMRLMALLQTELCSRRLAVHDWSGSIHGIMFGSDMNMLLTLMANTATLRRNYFVLDGNLESFHFLTCDHRGEVILQLLCHADQRAVLDDILMENLSPKIEGWPIEHDAVDEHNAPVLFAYTCDMPRIQRFDTALELQGRVGTLICFDFQESALHQVCGPRVTLQCIDFEQFERSVFHPKENPD